MEDNFELRQVSGVGMVAAMSSGNAQTPRDAILEILDNSIDANSTCIYICLSEYDDDDDTYTLIIYNNGAKIDDIRKLSIAYNSEKINGKIGTWGQGLPSIPGTMKSSLFVMSNEKQIEMSISGPCQPSDISLKNSILVKNITGSPINNNYVYNIIPKIKKGLISSIIMRDIIHKAIQETYVNSNVVKFYLDGTLVDRPGIFEIHAPIYNFDIYPFNKEEGGYPVIDHNNALGKDSCFVPEWPFPDIDQNHVETKAWCKYNYDKQVGFIYKKLLRASKDTLLNNNTPLFRLQIQPSNKDNKNSGGIHVALDTKTNVENGEISNGKRILSRCNIPYKPSDSTSIYVPWVINSICMLSAHSNDLCTTANKSATNNIDTFLKIHPKLFVTIMYILDKLFKKHIKKEKTENEKVEKENDEKERVEKENAEKENAEKENAEKERVEKKEEKDTTDKKNQYAPEVEPEAHESEVEPETNSDDASDDASIYTCSKCEFQGNWDYGDGDTFHLYVQNSDQDIDDDELFCVDRERDFICTKCEEEINGPKLIETDEGVIQAPESEMSVRQSVIVKAHPRGPVKTEDYQRYNSLVQRHIDDVKEGRKEPSRALVNLLQKEYEFEEEELF